MGRRFRRFCLFFAESGGLGLRYTPFLRPRPGDRRISGRLWSVRGYISALFAAISYPLSATTALIGSFLPVCGPPPTHANALNLDGGVGIAVGTTSTHADTFPQRILGATLIAPPPCVRGRRLPEVSFADPKRRPPTHGYRLSSASAMQPHTCPHIPRPHPKAIWTDIRPSAHTFGTTPADPVPLCSQRIKTLTQRNSPHPATTRFVRRVPRARCSPPHARRSHRACKPEYAPIHPKVI